MNTITHSSNKRSLSRSKSFTNNSPSYNKKEPLHDSDNSPLATYYYCFTSSNNNVREKVVPPKSKALLRVLDQANEDTHLADVEMKRELQQLRNLNTASPINNCCYQCSNLNPELELTCLQFISTNGRKLKKSKVSENNKFQPYNKATMRRSSSYSNAATQQQQHYINLQETNRGLSRLSISE